MHKLKFVLGIILISLFSLNGISVKAQKPQKVQGNSNLSVEIKGIEKLEGRILVALYNSEKGFPKRKLAFRRATMDATAETLSKVFKNIPEGEYSVMVLHDENADKKFNRNAIGLPEEAYGFSNNVKPRFSIPSFKETKFMVKGNQTITIELVN